jgi:hypothetical protein
MLMRILIVWAQVRCDRFAGKLKLALQPGTGDATGNSSAARSSSIVSLSSIA